MPRISQVKFQSPKASTWKKSSVHADSSAIGKTTTKAKYEEENVGIKAIYKRQLDKSLHEGDDWWERKLEEQLDPEEAEEVLQQWR